MTTNPNRLKRWRRNDLQKIKSAKGVEAKKRLMAERWQAWRDVGGFVTDGVLGKHSVRLLASDSFGERLAVVVDGEHRQARTLRGVAACVAKMIFNAEERERGLMYQARTARGGAEGAEGRVVGMVRKENRYEGDV